MTQPLHIPQWSSSFETGIAEIDFQHKYFLELMKRFNDTTSNDLSEKLCASHLNEIVLYAQFHFCSEENIMQLIEYPAYEDHKLLHIQILDELSKRIKLYEIGAITIFEIATFLVTWFIDHTTKEDIKLAHHKK